VSSEEFRYISEIKKLLDSNCKIEKVYPTVFASDAEVNIVTVITKCPNEKEHNSCLQGGSTCIKGNSKNLHIDYYPLHEVSFIMYCKFIIPGAVINDKTCRLPRICHK
jgi:hypothetical protein